LKSDMLIESESNRLLSHVGIDQQKEPSCVEEEHVESDQRDVSHLKALSRVAKHLHKTDAIFAKDVVDTDDDVRQRIYPEQNLVRNVPVLLTDRFTVV